MKDKEISALIKLLDDDDDEVFRIITQKLMGKGTDVVKDLEKAWENSLNQTVQERIETLIQKIQFESISTEMREWAGKGGENLLYGVFLIAKYQYPDLHFSEIEDRIEILRKDSWLEFNKNLTALEKVRIINHIMFAIHKFSANTDNFYSPGNSYINQVLETKKGNPISLAVIYSSVAQKLDMPVYGVNLPLNYLLAYKDSSFSDDPDGILFYINAYNRGTVISRKEIEFFLNEQKSDLRPEYFRPCSNIITIERILRNLYFSYEKMAYEEKTQDINKLLEIIELYKNP
jgi:regulator of sirC expression with transglutaminase-like and TPR domain